MNIKVNPSADDSSVSGSGTSVVWAIAPKILFDAACSAIILVKEPEVKVP